MSDNFGGMTDEKDNDDSAQKSCHGVVSPVLAMIGAGDAVMKLAVSIIILNQSG